MASLDELTDAVLAAPRGPRVAAFFDYDGTVIEGFSVGAFYKHRFRHLEIGPVEAGKTVMTALRGVEDEAAFAEFLELALGSWVGRPAEDMRELGASLFKHETAGRLHTEVWRLAAAHRKLGHTIVLASSASQFQVEPMAAELEADVVLCTRLAVDEQGRITGKTDGPALYGSGKSTAVRAAAVEHDLDLDASFGYSNGDEDVPFLECVGHPVAVAPESGLEATAVERGWPVLKPVPRPARPDVLRVARTAGFYGGMLGGAYLGIGAGLLNRSRRTFSNIAGGVGAEVGLSLAGIDVQVVSGQEHLWSARPCVFAFNHQSKLDPIVVMKLLRQDITGVAKKEVRSVPGFGQLFWAAGVAFVDRGNIKQAREAMQPAVDKITDEGLSLVIAPEGTRSPTPKLGPFKKGAFHIAMQAGVPMVPIVIRNAGEIMWRGSQTLNSGTVEVAVLEPIPSDGWTVERLDEVVADVRGRFLNTLEEWPS